jgi:hypothetical protein
MMKPPRRRFLHLAAGAAVLPAVSRIAWAQAGDAGYLSYRGSGLVQWHFSDLARTLREGPLLRE